LGRKTVILIFRIAQKLKNSAVESGFLDDSILTKGGVKGEKAAEEERKEKLFPENFLPLKCV
jgi:hypothetical protein